MGNKQELIDIWINAMNRPLTDEVKERIERNSKIPRFKINQNLAHESHKEAS